jgi:hypothetical protein
VIPLPPRVTRAYIYMKQGFTDFLKDALRQLTGGSLRKGKLSLSRRAATQMNELHLDTQTIEDVFRHGREVKSLVREYASCTISISYRFDDVKSEYVVTSVRRYEKEGRI